MKKRLGLLAAGGIAVALVAGGGVALASTPGPVNGNVITGCYTNAEVNGSHALVLQDADTTCPKGTSAVTWNEQGAAGPAGAAGPTGPQGPAGPAGAAGPTGPQGPAGPSGAAGPAGPTGPAGTNGTDGTDGNTILSGTGAPASTLGNDGDFYLDTAADVLYGPKAGGNWPATGVSLVGPQGPAGATGAQGPAGPAGPQGPAGSAGGTACTTDGGAVGAISVSQGQSGNAVSFSYTCVALTTDANCTHSDGLGQTYTDCNDLLGTHDLTTAQDAAAAYLYATTGIPGETELGNTTVNACTGDVASSGWWAPVFDSSFTQTGFVLWIYGGDDTGTVLTVNELPADASQTCDITATGTWN